MKLCVVLLRLVWILVVFAGVSGHEFVLCSFLGWLFRRSASLALYVLEFLENSALLDSSFSS